MVDLEVSKKTPLAVRNAKVRTRFWDAKVWFFFCAILPIDKKQKMW